MKSIFDISTGYLKTVSELENYLIENTVKYPVAFNGKTRFTIEVNTETSKEVIEKKIIEDERTIKRLDGKKTKKIIIIPNRMVNIVY